MQKVIENILLFGDEVGVNQLLHYIPHDRIAAVVVGSNRPVSFDKVEQLTSHFGIPLYVQPAKKDLSEYHLFYQSIRELEPDGLICNSYSMLLGADLLNLVEGRAFNIHYALLPKNRGCNPVEWALINGDKETGVTVHLLDEGVDSGDIVAQIAEKIDENETCIGLAMKLYKKSMILLEDVLPTIMAGNWERLAQNNDMATYNNFLSEEEIYEKLPGRIGSIPE